MRWRRSSSTKKEDTHTPNVNDSIWEWHSKKREQAVSRYSIYNRVSIIDVRLEDEGGKKSSGSITSMEQKYIVMVIGTLWTESLIVCVYFSLSLYFFFFCENFLLFDTTIYARHFLTNGLSVYWYASDIQIEYFNSFFSTTKKYNLFGSFVSFISSCSNEWKRIRTD